MNTPIDFVNFSHQGVHDQRGYLANSTQPVIARVSAIPYANGKLV